MRAEPMIRAAMIMEKEIDRVQMNIYFTSIRETLPCIDSPVSMHRSAK